MFEEFKNITPLLGIGVYILTYKDKVQYVGRTWCLLSRLGDHCSSPRKIPFDSVYIMLCSNAEEKEHELILKYKPRYNRETAYAFRGKSPEMHKRDRRHTEKEYEKLLTEIANKEETDDIVSVFKRRL
jgi:predicted GIY-YIG superfamily endonuclease